MMKENIWFSVYCQKLDSRLIMAKSTPEATSSCAQFEREIFIQNWQSQIHAHYDIPILSPLV